MATAMANLEFLCGVVGLASRLVEVVLIDQAFDCLGITSSDEDVQQAMNRFRQQHGMGCTHRTRRVAISNTVA
jgi:hypothetical protein